MRVDLRGFDGTMPQQFLDVADIGAAFDQVSGEAVAQDVRSDRLGNFCLFCDPQRATGRSLLFLARSIKRVGSPAIRAIR